MRRWRGETRFTLRLRRHQRGIRETLRRIQQGRKGTKPILSRFVLTYGDLLIAFLTDILPFGWRNCDHNLGLMTFDQGHGTLLGHGQ